MVLEVAEGRGLLKGWQGWWQKGYRRGGSCHFTHTSNEHSVKILSYYLFTFITDSYFHIKPVRFDASFE